MSEKRKSLNFIEQIIEEDLAKEMTKNDLRFRFPPSVNTEYLGPVSRPRKIIPAQPLRNVTAINSTLILILLFNSNMKD